MDDGFAPDKINPFDQYDPDKTPVGIPAPETTQDNQPAPQANPFDDLGDVVPEPVSTTGAVARGAEKSLLPAAGSLAAAGAGAELGGAAGSAVLPGIGTAVGALAGGIGGGILGAKGVDAAQNWLLSKLPDSFVDAFGLDERKERLDQQQHPVASFVGGLVPYAVTMRPSGFAKTALPENATALQTLMSHPVTAKLFGGGVMGGMELANEKADGQDLDWRKVAIATGFGVIFNHPNKIGEAITEAGAGPARTVLGRPGPTVAQAGDLKVMGPGVTESVFHGTQEQAPEAAMTAQETARTEQAALGEAPEPDVGNIARRMEPDLFGRYDELLNMQRVLSMPVGPEGEPWERVVARTKAEQEQEAENLKLHALGEPQISSPVIASHLNKIQAELDTLSPQVAAAYRRAADTMGTGTVAPEQFPSLAAMLAAHEHQTGRPNEAPANLPEVPNTPENAGEGLLPGVQPGTPEGIHQEVAGTGPEGVIGQPPAPNSIPRPQRSSALGIKTIPSDWSVTVTPRRSHMMDPTAANRDINLKDASGRTIFDATLIPYRDGYAISPVDNRTLGSDAVRGYGPAFYSKMAEIAASEGKKLYTGASESTSFEAKKLQDKLRSLGMLGEEKTALEGHVVAEVKKYTDYTIQHLQRTIGEQRAFIANDVSQKLIAAGRPAEEAEASGQLIAARYVTRAGRFDGKLGTPEELYTKEGAAIAGATGRALAPEAAPKPTTPRGKQKSPDERSLFETLAHEGGLKPDPELEAIFGDKKGPSVSGFGKLIRPDGRTLDDALRVAKEQGYLFDPSDVSGAAPTLTPRDLLDRLAEENSGRKQYKMNYVGPEKGPTKERVRLVKELQQQLAKNGETPDLFLADRAAELVDQGKESDVVSAYERAVMEQRDLHEAVQNQPEVAQNVDDYFQEARGKIRIAEGRRPIITLLKDANPSTFIHESGHQFLEELMRDADHPEAPPGLRDDAQTVRDWLGVTDDIKTKHHEKFARGFEQYMREGVAPSPGLAGVFAKFRNWLLSIYQSLKGLGAEINPDIRGVFDGMLEMEPQRTVVAPERASPTLLHDIHEAEAANVPPHEAEATMDRVVAERDRYISEQPPEVQRELEAAASKVEAVETAAGKTSGAPGEAFSGAVGQPEVGEGGGGSGPQSGGGAGGEEHAEIKPGGANAGAEGESARPDPRSGLSNNAGTALAPGPADLFGARESPFTDKAGNIRVENLTTQQDVAQAIRDSASENNDFIGDRRGVITDGQVMELADALGMDAQSLNQRQLGQAFNAEQIVAARKLLIQSATDVSAAMKKAATGTDQDVMAYAMAKDRHQMIQAQVAGITAEAGRALRAFRSIAGEEGAQAADQFIKTATGKTLFQLRQEAKLGAALQTPQQVSKMMQDAQKHSFGSMVLEYWINGLISGPATHMTYMVGNTISSILKLPETAAASAVGRAAGMLGREGPTVRGGEAGAMARGAAQGFPAAIKAGVEALKTGVTTQLPGEVAPQGSLPLQPGTDLAQPAQFQEGATYHDAMAATFGIVRGMRDGIMATGKLLAAGGVQSEPLIGTQYSPLGAIPDITLKGVNVLPLGSVVRVPGRFIASIHSFYRSINFSMEKNALAYRKAAEEGLTGDALASRVAQIRADPSEAQMNEIATHAATQTVLMGKGSELTQALSRVTNAKVFGFPLLKFIDPFVHISGNIIEQAVIQRTPVGLLTMLGPETELARDLTGKNGNASQDKAIGRMMVGTALSVTFGGLAAQGLMSGSGPSDPKESAMWRLAGNQAHSIRIGDMWYDTHRLGPIGMLAGIAADMYDVSHDAAKGDLLQAGAHLQHAFAQNILDESFMRGPAELIQAIEDPGRYGESYIRNFLSSFVPFSVGMSQMARATDPYTRQARTTMDAIKAKIPGMSESLMPRRDIWGEPMPSREVLGPAGLSAIYAQRMSNDPVNKAMLDIGVYPAQVEKTIRNVTLTPQEYDTYSQIAGRMVKRDLDKVVNSPMWQTMPIEAKRYTVQHILEANREGARGIMFGKFPHLVHDGTVAQRARMRGEKP